MPLENPGISFSMVCRQLLSHLFGIIPAGRGFFLVRNAGGGDEQEIIGQGHGVITVDLLFDEVQALVSEHLVSYKQVRLMELIDAIPKSAAGKILRRELRDA